MDKDFNFDNPVEVMVTFEENGGGEMDKERSVSEERYVATHKLITALIDAIHRVTGLTPGQSHDLLDEWLNEEDGELAITRLITLVIH